MYLRHVKRVLDIAVSILLLLGFSWVFCLILLSYIVTFSFPVIFRQRRIGRQGKAFSVFKFRTLKVDDLPLAQRTFPLGSFLRYTSLDELPQLINVLKGEMSLIGPRPLPVEYLPLFNAGQLLRHEVRPGITGWAQVNGRHSIPWEKKFKLDVYYVKNISFWLDMKIIFRTACLLFKVREDLSLQEQAFGGNVDA